MNVRNLNYDQMYNLATNGKLTLEDIYKYGNSYGNTYGNTKEMTMMMLTLAKIVGEVNSEN